LSLERAQVLANMLNVSINEITTRIGESLAPKRNITIPRSRFEQVPANAQVDDPDAALANLRSAVARARAALPQAEIKVSIKLDEEL
jgi:hypothetical protein